MISVGTTNTGSVRFVNCAFWGPCNQIAKIAGQGTVAFSDCTFMQWDHKNEGKPALQIESGTIMVRGCEFQQDKPQLELGENVRRAVVSDNLLKGEPRLINHSKLAVKLIGDER